MQICVLFRSCLAPVWLPNAGAFSFCHSPSGPDLPDQQSVVYRDNEPLPAALARGRTTTLTAWFKANRDHPEATDLLYADFPGHYTWPATKKWTPRRRPIPVVGRMFHANPGVLLILSMTTSPVFWLSAF